MKYAVIVGTRPDYLKQTPVLLAMKAMGMDYQLVSCQQHWDRMMSEVFLEEILPERPSVTLSLSQGKGRLREMLEGFSEVFRTNGIGSVVTYGDTMGAFAAGAAAKQLGLEVVHVEAGLRCGDQRMWEELFRTTLDAISDVMFCPTELQRKNLEEEGVKGQVEVVGNTILDLVDLATTRARESKILEQLGLQVGRYALVTLHRAEQVDDRAWLVQTFRCFNALDKRCGTKLVWPMHPRTKKRLSEFGLTLPVSVQAVDPLGYLDFLRLEQCASVILTDSGGVAEEACVLRVPCLILRKSTERQEVVDCGGARVLSVTDVEPDDFVSATADMLALNRTWTQPWGTVGVGKRIAEVLNART